MIGQGELDLRPEERSRTQSARPPGPAAPLRLALALACATALLWGAWVTRRLVAPQDGQIVSARLSTLVGEYVQAEARSRAPRAQVEAEMRRFLATLDRELQRRSARGEVVLVGEAVLSRNVPDITEALRRAVTPAGAAAQLSPADPPSSPGLVAPTAPAPASSSATQGPPRAERPGARLPHPHLDDGRILP